MRNWQRLSLAVVGLLAAPAAAWADTTTIETVYVLGAAKDPANADFPKDKSAAKGPELPVIYDKQATPKTDSGKPKS